MYTYRKKGHTRYTAYLNIIDLNIYLKIYFKYAGDNVRRDSTI